MDAAVPQSATAEPILECSSEAEVGKRDAANGSPATEEPPSKKARFNENESLKDEPASLRNRGIAPIKAE